MSPTMLDKEITRLREEITEMRAILVELKTCLLGAGGKDEGLVGLVNGHNKRLIRLETFQAKLFWLPALVGSLAGAMGAGIGAALIGLIIGGH